MTKSAFNALLLIHDLNAAFVGALLTQSPTFITSTAYVGPHYKLEHDISLLIPEIFARMTPAERNPEQLIKNGYLERCRDFPYRGQRIRAGRLGWRITTLFERTFFCRVFNTPGVVLPPDMLRPELQDKDIYADSIQTIVKTHEQVAKMYFEDGSVDLAVPPLKALLHVMAHGHYEGLQEDDPKFRALFTLENMLKSDWYAERLRAKQQVDIQLWQKHLENVQKTIAKTPTRQGELAPKLAYCQDQLAHCQNPAYLGYLQGTLGASARWR